jgi:hypothetical protein
MKHTLVFALILLAACATAPSPAPATTDSAELDIKSTVLAAYNVVSGPAGRRDWDRFKELFAPGGQVTHAMPDGSLKAMTPDDFTTIAKPMLDQSGLFEHPVSTRVQHDGNLATVLSAFESRHASNDAQPFQNGVDAFQLLHVNGAWKIISITRTINP